MKLIFLLILSFFHVVYAKTIVLPKPSGPHSVGTKGIQIKDPSRTMLRGSAPRSWIVQAFYPCEPHHVLNPYMPGTLNNGEVEGVHVLAHAEPDAIPIQGQFPLIIFIPGLGNERQKYTILLEELASHGYVVLSLDQPYVSNFVKFPDGSAIVLTFKDAWMIPRDRDYRYRYFDKAMKGAMGDITYILDHLKELKDLEKMLDSKTIVLMGHSFGGNVAHTLGFLDPRIKAVVDIDSKITERRIVGCIGVPKNASGKPVLFIRGMMQYQEDVGDQLTKIRGSTIWSPNVEHSAFEDQAFFAVQIPDFGQHGFLYRFIHWFLKRGPYFDNVGTNLGGKEVNAWFEEYREQIAGWLGRIILKNQLSKNLL